MHEVAAIFQNNDGASIKIMDSTTQIKRRC